MITDEFIKSEFIASVLTRDVRVIYHTQADVIRENLKSRTGELSRYVTRRPFEIEGGGMKKTLYVPVLPYLRFLDIRYRDGLSMMLRRRLALYNRVIWGVLYNETMPDLRYGFTEDIRKAMRADLEQFGGESSPELRTSWINNIL